MQNILLFCVCTRQCCVVWSRLRILGRGSVWLWLSVRSTTPPYMRSAWGFRERAARSGVCVCVCADGTIRRGSGMRVTGDVTGCVLAGTAVCWECWKCLAPSVTVSINAVEWSLLQTCGAVISVQMTSEFNTQTVFPSSYSHGLKDLVLLCVFRFVLLACDGLFKVFSADEAIQFVLNILEVRILMHSYFLCVLIYFCVPGLLKLTLKKKR